MLKNKLWECGYFSIEHGSDQGQGDSREGERFYFGHTLLDVRINKLADC